jgi:peptidoglycan/xylan/chitin deacetylase (PgdA/CDA1 family)
VENLSAPVFALTFTDGPTPGITGPLLDLLSSQGVVATFFPTGVKLGDADPNSADNRAVRCGSGSRAVRGANMRIPNCYC